MLTDRSTLLGFFGRAKRERRLIEPLFDHDFYRARYPDVAASGADPLTHFVQHGWREGRWPSGNFDTAWYLRQYPDVAASGQNPLLHYALHGRAEGRGTVAPPEPAPPVNVSISSDILRRFDAVRNSAGGAR